MRRRILIVVTVVFVSLALGVFAYTVKAARDNPIPNDARDLDCDGSISAFEWYTAGLNYGWRGASDGTLGCMEVFSLKDGLPAVGVCQQSPRCRLARQARFTLNCLPSTSLH